MGAKQDYHQLLRPETINSISGLSLISKVIVEGYLSGLHHSRRVGQGLEFSQYRAYEQGDDMRLLDWKMLARSGRYYVRQSELDTHTSVNFVVDASKSMLHKEEQVSKIDYAKVLVASLAHLAQKQGDGIGLYAINDMSLYAVNAQVHKQHFNRILQGLIDIDVNGKWPNDPFLTDKIGLGGRKELLVFITDFYEKNQELTSVIKSLKSPRNEVVVFHIMGSQELRFDYSEQLIFEDLETGSRLRVNTKKAKKDYLDSLNITLAGIKEILLSKDIGYQLFDLSMPIAQILTMYLKQRSRLY